ncbi:MAG: hypothetical protein QOJ93_2174, partial [Actinomycetota bacterium]|nr:hypothetical protein [Actinomycetota bacterium]
GEAWGLGLHQSFIAFSGGRMPRAR